jgi:hypothetical protein
MIPVKVTPNNKRIEFFEKKPPACYQCSHRKYISGFGGSSSFCYRPRIKGIYNVVTGESEDIQNPCTCGDERYSEDVLACGVTGRHFKEKRRELK